MLFPRRLPFTRTRAAAAIQHAGPGIPLELAETAAYTPPLLQTIYGAARCPALVSKDLVFMWKRRYWYHKDTVDINLRINTVSAQHAKSHKNSITIYRERCR